MTEDSPVEATPDDNAARRALGVLAVLRRTTELDPSAARRLAGVGALSFLGGAVEAGLLVLLARIAVAVAADTQALTVLPGWHLSIGDALIAAGAGLLLKVLLGVLSARLAASTAVHVLGSARFALLNGFFRATWSTQSTERTGELQELMTTHVDRTTAVALALANFVAASLNVCTLVVASMAVNPLAAATITVIGLFLSALLRPISGLARRNSAHQAVAGREFAGAVTESVGMAREARSFGVEERLLHRLRRLHSAQAERYKTSRFLMMLAPQLYQSAAILVLIAGIGIFALRGVSSLGEVGAVILLLLRALSYGQQAQSNFHQLNDMAPYVDELRRQRARYEAAASEDGALPVAEIGELDVDQVCFAYEPGTVVLKDVSFKIRRGETVGVIGPSGSGKSTLLQLLLRLRQASSGAIRLGGTDIREFVSSDWCRTVAFVPQDPRLFVGTVAENIAFFRDLDRSVIEEAARSANLHDEIMTLPRGYDELIGDRRTLSGGQQQRLCIARALVTKPALLILDEPTSALDMRSEARIQETLSGLHGSITLVIVAHRMTTLSACDRILVLTEGQVQGFDEHARLLVASPFYEEALRLSTIRATPSSDDR